MNDLNASARSISGLLADRADSIPVPAASIAAIRRRARQRSTRLRASAGAAGLALLGGAVGLAQVRSDRGTRSVTAGESVPSTERLDSVPSIEKTRLVAELKINSTGVAVVALQNRLKELAFDPGPADGYFGLGTRQAVWAFEKLVLGTLPGHVTGVVTDEMWQTMQGPIDIKPRRRKDQIYGQRPTHVEIYLREQVLIVFTDDEPVLITHISSGSDDSKTPAGVFSFYLRFEGKRIDPIEDMWNPVFFNYGIAIYGSTDVPSTPSSHGGIRIPNLIADYFPSLVTDKDRVYVWDGAKEPEEFSRDEKVPPGDYAKPPECDRCVSTGDLP